MPRLDFHVEVKDHENGMEYLLAVRNAFTAVIALNAWGYTQDELIATSEIDLDNHSRKVFDQELDI
jgi:hypothetical protein